MRLIKTLSFIVGIFTLSFVLFGHGSAQSGNNESFNLVTSPLPVNLTAKPGSTLSTDIRVKNAGTKPEKLKVGLMKFSAFGEEGKPAIHEREEGDDYFDWVSFSPQVFDAPQNEWVTVKMSISLPQSAAFGYYYAAVFSRADGTPVPSARQNVLVGSTAVLVLVNADVPGAKRSATVSSFTANKKFYEYLPAHFTVKIHNGGKVHVAPTGNIFIKSGSRTVAALKVNSAQGNILPGSNRIFTASWSDGFPVYAQKQSGGKAATDAQGRPVYELQWDFSKIAKLKMGRYSAHLLLAYDDGKNDVPIEAVVSFWVIPWRMLLIAVGIPLLMVSVIVYLYVSRRRIKKKLRKLSGHDHATSSKE